MQISERLNLGQEATTIYLGAPTAEPIKVPSYRQYDRIDDSLSQPGAIFQKLAILADSTCEGFYITDKNFPHAVEDVMWIDGRDDFVSTLHELQISQPAGVLNLFRELAVFAKTVEELGQYPVISWSNDPLTKHRISIQGEKRLHIHGTTRTNEEVQNVLSTVHQLGADPGIARKRTFDELSYIVASFAKSAPTPLNVEDLHPLLVSIRLDDWCEIYNPVFINQFIEYLRSIEEQYHETVEVLGGEDEFGQLNKIGKLDESEVQDALSGYELGVAQEIKNYLGRISTRPLSGPFISRAARSKTGMKHTSRQLVPLNGLPYSVTMSTTKGAPYAHIRFSKFADMGGAGATVIEGVPLKIQRNSGVMNPNQLNQRTLFQDYIRLLFSRGITQ